MPIRYQVNFFKGCTFLWILLLIYYFKNTSKGILLYLLLHGSYGIFWVLKDLFFPDARALKQATIGSHLLLSVLLGSYWAIPLPLVLGYGISSPSLLLSMLVVTLYVIGLILMLGSDYQKYQILKTRKGTVFCISGLITSGFFKYSRNPNYFG